MAFQATTGLGTATQIAVDAKSFNLSLGGVNTHQIVPNIQDTSAAVQPGVALALTAAATASAGTTVYTGTITGGASNAFAGFEFVVAGFVTGANNGTFSCTASTATTATLSNIAGVAETHAGTATYEGNTNISYVSRNTGIATVSASGLVTGVAKGYATVEAAYPAFNNTVGKYTDGTPLNKIFQEINVTVTA